MIISKQSIKVLFLCTGNSCRSQMAEGLINHDLGDRVQVCSAGVIQSYVHPKAIQVMKEIGIDISHHRSKHFKKFEGQSFDCVITLCDEAREACPVFPGATNQHHIGFTDPVTAVGSEDQILAVFRKVRDEIRKKGHPLVKREAFDLMLKALRRKKLHMTYQTYGSKITP